MARCEVGGTDATRGARVGGVEGGDEVRSMNVSFVYPSILRRTIALPSDQKLEAAAVQTNVQDLFHLVLLLSFH